ncbi:MAG: RsmE family RNA methyltransferase [Actinomycetota bacterium]|jgi:16S rRNA (uracil1498-N3)-methyltransferase
MSGPWFVAPPGCWHHDDVRLPPDESHHAARVLRVTPPDVITVTDGEGLVARCAVRSVDDHGVVAEVVEREEHRRFRPEIVVYQGAAKGSKVDSVVERMAELGVAETWSFQSSRSVVRWDERKVARLGERWTIIARSAAKQSRNPFVMQTGAGLDFRDLLDRVAREQLAVCLWEDASLPLRTALTAPAERVALVVGPEGGLERDEAEALADAGAQLVSLGPRILRTENAAFAAVSALLFHYGLIG